ncbi:penicillin-binding protein [Fusobacterium nucleatum]|uniref:penicillin-binding protein n=1 Tax=Fusobacterium nucleatum TaxID=851 RepID=UPI0030D38EC5
MKTINFYKKEKLIFSVYAESLEDVLKSPLSYFPAYTSDVIVTDISYQYPIYKDNTLREMTKEEKVRAGIEVQLEDGEIIKDKKIITVPKPQGNSKYLNWNKEKGLWLLDNEREYQDYMNLIDDLKEKSLDYGFDYKVDGKEHIQKCRDKDIAKMVATVVSLQLAKSMGVDKKVTWYFYDNFGMSAGLQELGTLMLYGTTFVQSVYDCENYFKIKVNPKELTKAEFENKRKEIHSNLVKG